MVGSNIFPTILFEISDRAVWQQECVLSRTMSVRTFVHIPLIQLWGADSTSGINAWEPTLQYTYVSLLVLSQPWTLCHTICSGINVTPAVCPEASEVGRVWCNRFIVRFICWNSLLLILWQQATPALQQPQEGHWWDRHAPQGRLKNRKSTC